MFEITYTLYNKTYTAYLPNLVAVNAIESDPCCELLSTRWIDPEEV